MTEMIRNVMSRKICRKDRIQFAGVLLVFAGLFFYMKYVKKDIPVEDFVWEITGIFVLLAAIVLFTAFGNSIIRGWLLIAGIFGKIIFSTLLLIVYFVFLVPVFGIIKLFSKPTRELTSNWSRTTSATNDYKKMG